MILINFLQENVRSVKNISLKESGKNENETLRPNALKIFFGTQTGKAKVCGYKPKPNQMGPVCLVMIASLSAVTLQSQLYISFKWLIGSGNIVKSSYNNRTGKCF